MNLTKEQLEHDFYELKLTQSQISIKYNCSVGMIQRARRHYDIALTRSKPHAVKFVVSKEQLEEDFFVLGLSQNQVCEKYNCSDDAIRRRMREFGIELNPSLKRTSQQQRVLLLNNTELTKRQQSIIIGSLLGDSHIGKLLGVQSKNANIAFSQCIRRKAYLEWKLEELVPFSRNMCIDKAEEGCSFETVRHPIFNDYYTLFVSNSRKIVPTNIGDYLDELALAVWWQDDGHKASASMLCTNSFTVKECEILIDAIKVNFDIEGQIRFQRNILRNKTYPLIYFYRDNNVKFHKVVDPLHHSCFKYKCIFL